MKNNLAPDNPRTSDRYRYKRGRSRSSPCGLQGHDHPDLNVISLLSRRKEPRSLPEQNRVEFFPLHPLTKKAGVCYPGCAPHREDYQSLIFDLDFARTPPSQNPNAKGPPISTVSASTT